MFLYSVDSFIFMLRWNSVLVRICKDFAVMVVLEFFLVVMENPWCFIIYEQKVFNTGCLDYLHEAHIL